MSVLIVDVYPDSGDHMTQKPLSLHAVLRQEYPTHDAAIEVLAEMSTLLSALMEAAAKSGVSLTSEYRNKYMDVTPNSASLPTLAQQITAGTDLTILPVKDGWSYEWSVGMGVYRGVSATDTGAIRNAIKQLTKRHEDFMTQIVNDPEYPYPDCPGLEDK